MFGYVAKVKLSCEEGKVIFAIFTLVTCFLNMVNRILANCFPKILLIPVVKSVYPSRSTYFNILSILVFIWTCIAYFFLLKERYGFSGKESIIKISLIWLVQIVLYVCIIGVTMLLGVLAVGIARLGL